MGAAAVAALRPPDPARGRRGRLRPGRSTRYGIGLVWPPGPRGFPWATLTINVTGAMALGILVVLVTERFTPNRLLRPLLGTGFLGGYTTFSTFAVDTVTLTKDGAAPVALAYLALTLAVGVSAAWLGIAFARAVGGDREVRMSGHVASPVGRVAC